MEEIPFTKKWLVALHYHYHYHYHYNSHYYPYDQCQFLSTDVTKTLMCSFVLSRLDYANSLLANFPKKSIQRLQKVQNAAARLTLKLRKTEHTTLALKQLHWLPIEARIIYKICLHCHYFFHATSPAYFSELLTIYTPARSL